MNNIEIPSAITDSDEYISNPRFVTEDKTCIQLNRHLDDF